VIFILDTNVVSETPRKRMHPPVAQWIEESEPEGLATTVVTIHEIQRGVERTRRSSPLDAAMIEAWLDGSLATGSPIVLPMNLDAWRLLGKMYETPALRHFLVTDPRGKVPATAADLAIASIAISAGHAIATRDIGHFKQIHACFPLPSLFDPFDRTWHVEPSDPVPRSRWSTQPAPDHGIGLVLRPALTLTDDNS
jgi:predicted nucleic acid-binding protein